MRKRRIREASEIEREDYFVKSTGKSQETFKSNSMFVSHRLFLSLLDRTEALSISCTVQVALRTGSPNDEVRSVAICAGSGGSMLLGVDADVYFTGEMSHVRLNTRRS